MYASMFYNFFGSKKLHSFFKRFVFHLSSLSPKTTIVLSKICNEYRNSMHPEIKINSNLTAIPSKEGFTKLQLIIFVVAKNITKERKTVNEKIIRIREKIANQYPISIFIVFHPI